MNVNWQEACDRQAIPNREFFEKCLGLAIKDSQTIITVRFVEKAESQQLNSKFIGKNKPTNVLSFPDQPIPGEATPELGALVFCPEIINSEAKQHKKDFTEYWAHMIIHGSLHLLGFTHDNDTTANTMESLEASIMQKLGYTNPYSED